MHNTIYLKTLIRCCFNEVQSEPDNLIHSKVMFLLKSLYVGVIALEHKLNSSLLKINYAVYL